MPNRPSIFAGIFQKTTQVAVDKNKNYMKEHSLAILEKDLWTRPKSDLSSLSSNEQFKIISDKSAHHPESITTKEGLLQRLADSKNTNRPLNIKFGIDPTGPDIHIGHAISLLMLRRFQQMGHRVQLVVGSFTAKIGDPSGRTRSRTVLTDSDIQRNMQSYLDQAGTVIDLKKTDVYYNGDWLSEMTMNDWIPILQKISAGQMFEREDFQKRLSTGSVVSLSELMYTLFMAYDSVVLKPDVELGGIDQFINLHWARRLMEIKQQKPEEFVTVELLPGTTGKKEADGRLAKMSKSQGNYISVNSDPKDMYGRVMSIPDEVMWIWLRELTEISKEELEELKKQTTSEQIHPMEVKTLLARLVVATFTSFDHSIVEDSEKAFYQKFGKNKLTIPEDKTTIRAKQGQRIIDLLSSTSGKSKGMIKKDALGNGIRILKNDKYIPLDIETLLKPVEPGQKLMIKIGKRYYYEIIVS